MIYFDKGFDGDLRSDDAKALALMRVKFLKQYGGTDVLESSVQSVQLSWPSEEHIQSAGASGGKGGKGGKGGRGGKGGKRE